MEVSADLVAWQWATGFADRRALVDALLEGPLDQVGVSCYQVVEDWTESGRLDFEVRDALETIVAETEDKTLGQRLRAAFWPVLSCDDRFDELELAPLSDGCFYASLSPPSVSAAAEALAGLDLPAIAHELNPDEEADYLAYLNQWAALLLRGRERGWGLIAHAG